MITIEEKLNIFSKLVLEKEQKEVNEKLGKMQEKNKQIIEAHTEKIRKKAEVIIQKKIKQANLKKNEMISQAKLEIMKTILSKKKELLNALLEQIKHRAMEFTNSKEYESFLIKNTTRILTKLNDNCHINIYLTDKDMKKFKIIIERLIDYSNIKFQKITFTTIDDSIIGGIIVVNEDKGIRIDATLKTIIEDKIEIIGQIANESVEEAGDSNE